MGDQDGLRANHVRARHKVILQAVYKFALPPLECVCVYYCSIFLVPILNVTIFDWVLNRLL
jgi:hypothetical protein